LEANAVVLRGNNRAQDKDEAHLLVEAAYATPKPPKIVEVRAKGARGPKQGEVARHLTGDRALFSAVRELIAKGGTASSAALSLAREGKVQGIGSSESRAKRLASLYIKENKTR
jgi:hypothetical protein